jgi:hypothetical protein
VIFGTFKIVSRSEKPVASKAASQFKETWMTERMREDFFDFAYSFTNKPELPIQITLLSQDPDTQKGGTSLENFLKMLISMFSRVLFQRER